MVTKVEHVEISIPVLQPLAPELTADCMPRYLYPEKGMTIEAVADRLEAVEIALAFCRNQLELIRAQQPTK